MLMLMPATISPILRYAASAAAITLLMPCYAMMAITPLLKIRCQIATILYMLLHIAAIAAAFRRAFEDRYFAISPLHTLALR
jgi:hypothetical protein